MAQYQRTDRISGLLQRELANLLQKEIRDPRLPSMISISEVKVSKDLSIAKVYITLLESDPTTIKTTLKILNHAAGYLRAQIGSRIQLRVTPQLKFVYDESIAHAAHIIDLINKSEPKNNE